MAKRFETIQAEQKTFIEEQHIFFIATAPLGQDGHVNLSPKGLDSFVILSEKKVAYLDLTGSGNETSAHLLENGRITCMFCSFQGPPKILRLYGTGDVIMPNDGAWPLYAKHFNLLQGYRQIITIDVHSVQTSCGYGVPIFDFKGERKVLVDWAEKKGEEGIQQYILEKNVKSLDGLMTHAGLDTSKK